MNIDNMLFNCGRSHEISLHFHSLYHTLIDLSAFDALRQALPSLVVFVFVLNERHNLERLLCVQHDFVISGS